MNPRALWILIVAAAVMTAGCVDSLGGTGDERLSDQDTLEPAGNQTDEGAQGADDESSEGDSGDQAANRSKDRAQRSNNTSQTPETPDHPPWPPIDQATIRPGVQVIADGSQCTSNFLFRTPDNSSLFLGLAAHCVTGISLGDSVSIPAARANGSLAYSAWKVDGEDAEKHGLDFALVKLDPDARGTVHPSVQGWGGPTGLADPGQVDPQDKVLFYGNSGARGGQESIQQSEGYVVQKNGQATFQSYLVTPGIPGDSGSGVLTGSGEAVGVLVRLVISPMAGATDSVFLSTALQQAAERGTAVELVTWDNFSGTQLPG